MSERCFICMKAKKTVNEDCKIIDVDGNKIPLCNKHEKMFEDGTLFFEEGTIMCRPKMSDDKKIMYMMDF